METIVAPNMMFSRFSNEALRKMISDESWPSIRAQKIQYAEEVMRLKYFDILHYLSGMNEIDRANERKAMTSLAGKVCKESFEQFEQEVLARATK